MASPCGREHSSQSTRLWSLRFVVTGLPGQVLLTMMGPHSREARRRKERTYPTQLSGDGGRAPLVVLAQRLEAGGVSRTAQFLVSLAKAKADAAPDVVARQGPAGLHQEVECSAGLFGSSCVLRVFAGPPSCASPRRDPFGERGGA